MKFTMLSAILFFLGWMSVVTGKDKPYMPGSCCLEVKNTRVQAEYIVKYDIQEAVICPVRAVRFYTKNNKVLCSDPESGYAKRMKMIVDGRMTQTPSKEPIKCYTSTTNMIPAVTTANKTPGTPTEASTGDGCPENCNYTVIPTSIPVNPPFALGRILTRKRSRSRNALRKVQSKTMK